jgi:hypothetical protein
VVRLVLNKNHKSPLLEVACKFSKLPFSNAFLALFMLGEILTKNKG